MREALTLQKSSSHFVFGKNSSNFVYTHVICLTIPQLLSLQHSFKELGPDTCISMWQFYKESGTLNDV